jgi:hypothetical protein
MRGLPSPVMRKLSQPRDGGGTIHAKGGNGMIVFWILAGLCFVMAMVSLGYRASQAEGRHREQVANAAADRIIQGLKDK